MSYKPKFCCQCGDPIERDDWKFLTSRRFCELCETDYKLEDWIPRVIIVTGILFGVFGLGTFLRKPEKPLNLASANAANISKSAVGTAASINANAASSKIQETNLAVAQQPVKSATTLPTPNLPARKIENQANAISEPVYFCGAETKKGTPCTRRVKGGGRCWQHLGKPAMLPPEKLLASR